MKIVGPEGKMAPFSSSNEFQICPEGQICPIPSSNEAQSRKNQILLIFMCYSSWIFGDSGFQKFFYPNYFMDVRYDLINTEFFIIRDFEKKICQNFLWMSVTTLLMLLVGPKVQTGPFSSSNEPQSRKNHILPIFMC
ncbi:hypothetical protein H5410_058919 [Solanum commersonii]|uniref:Uncharacterized protein n=1 Tax=Solanum commersonii TaxID=4109 RepID=A0A9J5W157_SOLCO|nr:hypothetical protein H5410_058919 [Solanum commersonii]